MGKTKVVIDTNVFVSALLKYHSKEWHIYKLALNGKIKLFVSEPLLAELSRVIKYPKFKISPLEGEIFLKNVLRIAFLVKSEKEITIIKEDPPDNRILECAVDIKAHYIITGDNHLKLLKEYLGTKIVSPDKFLRLFKSCYGS